MQRTRDEFEAEPEFRRVDEQRMGLGTTQPGTTQPATVQQQDTMRPEPRDRQIVFQDENTILASTMIDTDLHIGTAADDELGQIRDVIITMDGQVEGVVIGVGGFLGLGEKDVVVAMDRLAIERIGDDVRVSVLDTREDLETAEGFQQPRQQQ